MLRHGEHYESYFMPIAVSKDRDEIYCMNVNPLCLRDFGKISCHNIDDFDLDYGKCVGDLYCLLKSKHKIAY